ncbi:hypothetical protein [Paenibacillus sp. IHBB 10380]|uniref:hypothetical protein n=1 Tax=Paenibacillus sp. IHBB 10380 TaxID=1566358 RepID=UPI0005CFA149|nr:hypothetical protein [Paenibacillus sp. IHBB 10380]AJS58964.1 hypothetical protein UB51_11310 [Paenibacillus sp. IHBB 10380]
MPWPMVHFSVATRLLSNPSSEFLLGSLAPDSIHVRTNERIEKAKTHLMLEEGKFATDEDLKSFFEYNKHLAFSNSRFMQYLCGYIAHVYADREWTFDIYPEYELHPNGRSIYTQDVTKFEFLILRNKPETRELLSKLEAGKAFELGGLLEQEVYQYREEKIRFIKNLENEPLSDSSILTMYKLEGFINTTALGLRRLFMEWDVFSKLEEARNFS